MSCSVTTRGKSQMFQCWVAPVDTVKTNIFSCGENFITPGFLVVF